MFGEQPQAASWGSAAGSSVSAPPPTPLAMGTVGKPRHGLFADSCLLTACPKPCVKQPQMAPALRCFPSTRGFRGKLERVPPTRKAPPPGRHSAISAQYKSTVRWGTG